MNYKIEHHFVTGVKGSHYKIGQIVDESVFIASHIKDLIKNGSISLIEEKKTTKKEE
jgi:hypothetical protein